jgi:ribosome-binding protein aMBF1 (putative translation factor)
MSINCENCCRIVHGRKRQLLINNKIKDVCIKCYEKLDIKWEKSKSAKENTALTFT